MSGFDTGITPDGWAKPVRDFSHTFDANPRHNRSVDLRVGEIYGARTFKVTEDGFLAGVTYQKIWKPGVNEAECWKVTAWDVPGYGHTEHRPARSFKTTLEPAFLPMTGDLHLRQVTRPAGWNFWDETAQEMRYTDEEPVALFGNQEEEGHSPLGCQCGMHGYLQGSMDYANSPHAVSGIVRAFGKVVLGERGFRAQRAEIRALYFPLREEEEGTATLTGSIDWARVNDKYSSKDLNFEQVQLISEHYPNVPIYFSLEEMLRENPTTEPRDAAGGES